MDSLKILKFVIFVACLTSANGEIARECSDTQAGITPPPDSGHPCGWKFYKSHEGHAIYLGTCAPCHVLCDKDIESCRASCPEYYAKCRVPIGMSTVEKSADVSTMGPVFDEKSFATVLKQDEHQANAELPIILVCGVGVFCTLLIAAIAKRKSLVQVFECLCGRPHFPIQVTEV